MVGSTAVDSFFALVMVMLKVVAHDGGRMYRYATVGRGNFSDDPGVLWMVLSFANEPLELSWRPEDKDLQEVSKTSSNSKTEATFGYAVSLGFVYACAMDEQTNVQRAFLQGMTAMAEAARRAAIKRIGTRLMGTRN